MRSSSARLGLCLLLSLLTACVGGGGNDAPKPVPPSITAPPQNATIIQGQSATFTVTAGGTAPLTYQWRKGGAALAGGSGTALTITSAQPGDAGSYDVVVSNSAGSVTSSAATLTVNVPPTISVQPQNQIVLAPGAATFSVTATGTAPLSYQWKRNGTDLAGATSASYSTPATTGADHGAVYAVTVSNVAGSLASANATLTVNVAAAITVQPQAQVVIAPAPANFAVTAVGTAPLAYQWRKNGTPIVGATSASYSTPATTGADSGAVYSVAVSNGFGTDTSSNAALTVNLPPAITVQPVGQAVIAPAAATFSVTATGTAPLSYQWKKNMIDIPGAVSASYTTPATTVGDNNSSFTVAVSSPYGSVTSNGATLTVSAAPVAPTITVQPADQTVLAPATGNFSVTATGTAPLSYQWKRNGVAVGTNASTYSTPPTTLGDNGSQYTVTVTNAVGSANSGTATLTVNAAPTITANPSNQTVTAPATATFSVSATGTAPLSYQWKKGGVNIGGAVSSSYTTPATVVGDSGSTYSVTVSNGFGSANSGSATLTVNAPAALDLTIPTVYITQATQTPAFNVPLVKDRNGYLRAFVVANVANTATPQVRVRIYNAADVLQNTWTINAPGASVPLSVNESSLANSWNVAIPSTYIQPGYKLQVDVDPANAIGEASESNNYWISSTPQTLDVRTLNPFRVTFWSVETSDAPTHRFGNVNSGSIATFTSLLEKIWPTNNATDRLYGGVFTVTDVLLSDGTGWGSVLGKLDTKRTADGVSNRYYYGVVNPNYGGGVAGLGYIGWPVAIGWDKSSGYSDSGLNSGVYAHEVGHNFGISHAPCGGPGGPDPAYPYAGGVIGVWGTDVATATLKDPTTWKDIMGYCSSVWVSDYNYKKVLANRQGGSVPVIIPEPTEDPTLPRSLLLWGRLDNGNPVLEPSFHMAVDALPPAAGDQLLEGFDARGQRLFSVPFGLVEVGCLPEGSASHFSFSIPLAPADAERLSELRWTKAGELMSLRGGSAAMRTLAPAWEPVTQVLFDGRTRLLWDAAAHPMVMVRDRATGNVLGFGEGGDFRFSAEAGELEYHFSDGVRSHSKVVRRPRLDD